jgi:RND family efflux transporter MFP subunit
LTRERNLLNQGLISETDVDTAELAASRAKANVLLARTELERTRERFEDTVIQSPVSGTVLQKAVEVGQVISSATSSASGGTVIASIADMTRVQVTAEVNEIDIGRVRPGMEATIVADAYPNRTFTGEVIRIAPEAKVVQNVTLFDVMVEVENPEGILKSGMNCGATIDLVRKDDVLLVPTVALHEPSRERGPGERGERDEQRERGKRGEVTVTVKTAGGFEDRAIRLGLRNFDVAEVLEGLEEGEELKIELRSRAWEDSQRLQDRIRDTRGFRASAGRS